MRGREEKEEGSKKLKIRGKKRRIKEQRNKR